MQTPIGEWFHFTFTWNQPDRAACSYVNGANRRCRQHQGTNFPRCVTRCRLVRFAKDQDQFCVSAVISAALYDCVLMSFHNEKFTGQVRLEVSVRPVGHLMHYMGCSCSGRLLVPRQLLAEQRRSGRRLRFFIRWYASQS